MKVGDLVRQNPDNGLIKIKGSLGAKKKREICQLGTVIAIHDGVWPKDWDLSDHQVAWELKIGRRVDILWASGHISKNFAENVLEVVVADDADKK